MDAIGLRKLLLTLQQLDGVTDTSLRKMILCRTFDELSSIDPEKIVAWLKCNLRFFSRTKEKILSLTPVSLIEAKEKGEAIERSSRDKGIGILSYFDADYPSRFREMALSKRVDFPVILYFKGNVALLNAPKTVAIIGTRNPSPKAVEVGLDVARRVSADGNVVISGLAEGCDTIGHKGCIEAGGKTIAIVGTSLDTVYPKSNSALEKEILLRDGLILSEYPVGYKTTPYSFVLRDRLQAALSDAVIVVQTSKNGGTMHAATDAVSVYRKTLMVISPSRIEDGDTDGNEFLIKEYGAKQL